LSIIVIPENFLFGCAADERKFIWNPVCFLLDLPNGIPDKIALLRKAIFPE
jgi:hypothetical protein